ncbi:MAG: hemolysin family protein [Pseudomonadota bacterium]
MKNEPEPTQPDAASTQTNGAPGRSPSPEEISQQSTGWLAAISQALGLSETQSLRGTLEQTLRADKSGEASFTDEERNMLLRLLEFGTCRVEDVMVPRADIIALEESEPVSELLRTFQEAGVSRIPVFSETLDDPRGMVHIKDLFDWMMSTAAHATPGRQSQENNGRKVASATSNIHVSDKGDPSPAKAPDSSQSNGQVDLGCIDLSRSIAMTKIRREVLFVPLSMPAMSLLIRMQSTRIHMALVVDEYGGTDGLVTIEDLIEQIVGEIEDEHDELEVANISADLKSGLIASARTLVEELEEHLGQKLLTPEEDEEIDTLGGLVFTIVGRVPARGELVRHHSGLEFEVLDADARRVKKLKVHRPLEIEEPTTSGGRTPTDNKPGT